MGYRHHGKAATGETQEALNEIALWIFGANSDLNENAPSKR
jgi:hypothetical protein